MRRVGYFFLYIMMLAADGSAWASPSLEELEAKLGPLQHGDRLSFSLNFDATPENILTILNESKNNDARMKVLNGLSSFHFLNKDVVLAVIASLDEAEGMWVPYAAILSLEEEFARSFSLPPASGPQLTQEDKGKVVLALFRAARDPVHPRIKAGIARILNKMSVDEVLALRMMAWAIAFESRQTEQLSYKFSFSEKHEMAQKIHASPIAKEDEAVETYRIVLKEAASVLVRAEMAMALISAEGAEPTDADMLPDLSLGPEPADATALLEFLQSPEASGDVQLRSQALRGLAILAPHTPRALAVGLYLRENDPDPLVREIAAEALKYMNVGAEINRLLELETAGELMELAESLALRGIFHDRVMGVFRAVLANEDAAISSELKFAAQFWTTRYRLDYQAGWLANQPPTHPYARLTQLAGFFTAYPELPPLTTAVLPSFQQALADSASTMIVRKSAARYLGIIAMNRYWKERKPLGRFSREIFRLQQKDPKLKEKFEVLEAGNRYAALNSLIAIVLNPEEDHELKMAVLGVLEKFRTEYPNLLDLTATLRAQLEQALEVQRILKGSVFLDALECRDALNGASFVGVRPAES